MTSYSIGGFSIEGLQTVAIRRGDDHATVKRRDTGKLSYSGSIVGKVFDRIVANSGVEHAGTEREGLDVGDDARKFHPGAASDGAREPHGPGGDVDGDDGAAGCAQGDGRSGVRATPGIKNQARGV